AFCDQPHAFLPMSRALTCASCPDALDNGVFTGWQQAAHETVPQCALGHVPTLNVTPFRVRAPSVAARRTVYILRDSPRPAKAGLRQDQPMSRFRRLFRWLLLLAALLVLVGLLAGASLYYVVSSRLPEVESLRDVELQEPMYVYAR